MAASIDLTDNPTARYRRSNTSLMWNAAAHFLDNEPWFTWYDVPRMCRDPQIRFGLKMLRSPFQGCKWEVKSSYHRVARFVDLTLKHFWQYSLPRLLTNYFKWGRSPGGAESQYDRENRLWKLKCVRAIEPVDAQARVYSEGKRTGQLVGFDLPTDRGCETILRPHAFWFAGGEELCAHHDWPRIAGSFTPWLEKNGRGGARHSRRLWYWRHAFGGGTIRHPNDTIKLPDGSTMHSEDVARQMGDNFLNGSVIVAPNTAHASDKMAGKFAWEFEQPESRPDTAGMRDYPKDLDEEIMVGLEIPPEVWKASATGSGYSGRAIPMEAWLGGADDLAAQVLNEFKHVLDSLVQVNFGGKAYEVELIPLVDQFRKQSEQGDASGEPEDSGDNSGGSSLNGYVPYKGPRGGRGLLDPRTGKIRRGMNLSGNDDAGFRRKARKAAAMLSGQSPHEAKMRRLVTLAMIEVAERAMREGKSPDGDLLESLAELADDPDELQNALAGSGINLSWVDYGQSRSGKQRWKDSETGRLRYQKSKPGEASEKRSQNQANAKRGSDLVYLALTHQASAEHLRELATHLPAMTVDQLRSARTRLMASFKNGTRRDQMIAALTAHVEGRIADVNSEDQIEDPARETAKTNTAAKPRKSSSIRPAIRENGTPKDPQREDVYTVHPKSLKTDPKRFQYKAVGVREDGVTDELRGTKTWNPELGGVLLVWRDPADGEDFVINGHHRHELANRIGTDKINVRYINAPDDVKARAAGALANIAEGRGTATDAAKFMRDTETTADELASYGVSLSGKVANEAMALKDLSKKAFDSLVQGNLDERKAVVVASQLKDEALQDLLFKKLAKQEDDGKEWSLREIGTAAKKLARSGKVTEKGTNLFGDFEDEKSTFEQEVEIESYIGKALNQALNDFTAVSNSGRAERVKDAGNTLAIDENKRRRDQAAEHLETFDRDSGYVSPISATIKEAAAELFNAKGKKAQDAVKQRTLERVREILANPSSDGRGQGLAETGNANNPVGAEPPVNADRPDSGSPEVKPVDSEKSSDAGDRLPIRPRVETSQRDIFGNSLPNPIPGPKQGQQITIEDAVRDAWNLKATEWAADKGHQIEAWESGGRFKANGRWYQVGRADDGYPITEIPGRQ